MSGAPRAVVFDCDGLLIDSEVRWAVAERRVVEALGGDWTAELRERMVGGSGDDTAREIAAWVGLPESGRATAILREVYAGYLAVLDELGVEPMPGAHERRRRRSPAGCRSRSRPTRARRPCGRRSRRAGCRPSSTSSSRPIRDAGRSPNRTCTWRPARRSASRPPMRSRSRTRRREPLPPGRRACS